MFNISISGIDGEIKWQLISLSHLSNFTSNIQMSSAVDTPAGEDVIHKDKLVKWTHRNLVRFNKAKYEVLHLGQCNPQYQHRVGDEKLDMSQQ